MDLNMGPITIRNTLVGTSLALQVADYTLEVQKEPTREKELRGTSDIPLCSNDGSLSNASQIMPKTSFVAADSSLVFPLEKVLQLSKVG